MDGILPLLQGNAALMTLGLLWLIVRDGMKIWRAKEPAPKKDDRVAALSSDVRHISDTLNRIEKSMTHIEHLIGVAAKENSDEHKAIDDKVHGVELRLVALESHGNRSNGGAA